MRSLDQIEGMLVMSTKEGKNLGRVRHCSADLAKGELVGLIVYDPDTKKEWGLAASDIEVLGRDAVMVESEALIKAVSAISRLQRYRLDTAAEPLQVVTSAGRQLGELGRVYLDSESLKIVGYEVTGPTLKTVVDGTPHLPVMKGAIHGEDALVVPPHAEQHLERSTGGLKQAWARLAGFGRDVVQKTKARVPAQAKKAKAKTKRKSAKSASSKSAARPKKSVK